MAICKDKTIDILNEHGYNVVRLPRTGINPLDIIGISKDKREILGSLKSIWKSRYELKANQGTSLTLKGTQTANLKSSFGVNLLSNILGSFGVSVPQLETAYQGAASVQFTFSNIATEGYAPIEIGNFLSAGDLNERNSLVRDFFLSEEKNALVITEILKSKEITVTSYDENNTQLGIDVNALQPAVKGKVEIKSTSSSNTTLTYVGNNELTFGFKCMAIGIENGDWKLEISHRLTFLSNDSSNQSLLLSKGRLTDL